MNNEDTLEIEVETVEEEVVATEVYVEEPSFLRKYGKRILIWGGVAAGIVLSVMLLNRTSDLEEDVEEIAEELEELREDG